MEKDRIDLCGHLLFNLGFRCKQCKAREGQKDEIDLVGHRSLLPEAVTQQCAVDMPQKGLRCKKCKAREK